MTVGRKVAVLVAQDYEDLEVWYPKLRLEEAGVSVVVAGLGESSYLSKHGYPVTTDADISALDAADVDGVIVPGGWAPDVLRRSEAVTSFVARIAAAGGLVAAICHGGSVLVSADVVRGKRLTSFVAIRDDLRNAGADWVDAPVVVDGSLVTSRKPADLPVFMPAILSVLEERAHREGGDRLSVDADLVSVTFDEASLEYMLDMLNRMPASKAYRATDAPEAHSPADILRDFASFSDPRGPLEAEPIIVVDVVRAGEGYRGRGNSRLLRVLTGAGVPAVRVAG